MRKSQTESHAFARGCVDHPSAASMEAAGVCSPPRGSCGEHLRCPGLVALLEVPCKAGVPGTGASQVGNQPTALVHGFFPFDNLCAA